LFFSEALDLPQSFGVLMKREIGIGLAVVAGAALLEAALVPGILLGGAALLAPDSCPDDVAKSAAERPGKSTGLSLPPAASLHNSLTSYWQNCHLDGRLPKRLRFEPS
jgi:hypothetical protein